MIDQDEELVRELQLQLHDLADWIEKNNGVHCHSVPRKAAYTLSRLQEQNKILRLQLNKKDITIKEIADRYIGTVKLYVYLLRKKWNKNL